MKTGKRLYFAYNSNREQMVTIKVAEKQSKTVLFITVAVLNKLRNIDAGRL